MKIIYFILIISSFAFGSLKEDAKDHFDKKIEESKNTVTNKMDEVADRKTKELENRSEQKVKELQEKINKAGGSDISEEATKEQNYILEKNFGNVSLAILYYEKIKLNEYIKKIDQKLSSKLEEKKDLDASLINQISSLKEMKEFQQRNEKRIIVKKIEEKYINNDEIDEIFTKTKIILTPIQEESLLSLMRKKINKLF